MSKNTTPKKKPSKIIEKTSVKKGYFDSIKSLNDTNSVPNSFASESMLSMFAMFGTY